MKSSVKSSASSVVLLGMNIPPFMSRQAVTIITSFCSDLGSSTMWSMDIDNQGLSLMGNGSSKL